MKVWRKVLQPVDELTVTTLLNTEASIMAESELYGTSVCRVVLVGQSGKSTALAWPTALPMTVDLMDKVSKYMGVSNGGWDTRYAFDVYPNNTVTKFKSVTNTYTSADVSAALNVMGLVSIKHSTPKTLFYPNFQTIYFDDTSILSSIPAMMACCNLQRIYQQTWVQLVGNTQLTQRQFCERSDELITKAVEGKFDNRFVIKPKTTFPVNGDGTQWVTTSDIYANIPGKVGNFTIATYRMTDVPIKA